MTVQTIKIGKREYVLLPKRDFERIQARADDLTEQDRGDIAEAERRESEESVPPAEVRKHLGL